MNPTDEPAGLVDWSGALDAAADDESLLDELVTVFREEAPVVLQQLHTALQQRNSKDVQRAAHTLKGSFRIFGAAQAIAVSEELETRGRLNQLDQVGGLVKDLESCIDKVMAELKRWQER